MNVATAKPKPKRLKATKSRRMPRDAEPKRFNEAEPLSKADRCGALAAVAAAHVDCPGFCRDIPGKSAAALLIARRLHHVRPPNKPFVHDEPDGLHVSTCYAGLVVTKDGRRGVLTWLDIASEWSGPSADDVEQGESGQDEQDRQDRATKHKETKSNGEPPRTQRNADHATKSQGTFNPEAPPTASKPSNASHPVDPVHPVKKKPVNKSKGATPMATKTKKKPQSTQRSTSSSGHAPKELRITVAGGVQLEYERIDKATILDWYDAHELADIGTVDPLRFQTLQAVQLSVGELLRISGEGEPLRFAEVVKIERIFAARPQGPAAKVGPNGVGGKGTAPQRNGKAK